MEKKHLKSIVFILLFVPIILSAQIILTTEDVSCHGWNDGKITVTIGIPGVFEYALNGGGFQSSNSFSNLAAGNYTVTVMDLEMGCEGSESTTINEPTPILATVSGGGIYDYCIFDGPPTVILTATAFGGTPPYIYWPGSTLSVNSSASYSIYVGDSNGCKTIANAVVWLVPHCYEGSSTELLSFDTAYAQAQNGVLSLQKTFKNLANPFDIEAKIDPPDQLELFPNPAKDYFYLDLFSLPVGQLNIVIADQLGKIIYEKILEEEENRLLKINLNDYNFEDGIYMIGVIHREGKRGIKLVVKQFVKLN